MSSVWTRVAVHQKEIRANCISENENIGCQNILFKISPQVFAKYFEECALIQYDACLSQIIKTPMP